MIRQGGAVDSPNPGEPAGRWTDPDGRIDLSGLADKARLAFLPHARSLRAGHQRSIHRSARREVLWPVAATQTHGRRPWHMRHVSKLRRALDPDAAHTATTRRGSRRTVRRNALRADDDELDVRRFEQLARRRRPPRSLGETWAAGCDHTLFEQRAFRSGVVRCWPTSAEESTVAAEIPTPGRVAGSVTVSPNNLEVEHPAFGPRGGGDRGAPSVWLSPIRCGRKLWQLLMLSVCTDPGAQG